MQPWLTRGFKFKIRVNSSLACSTVQQQTHAAPHEVGDPKMFVLPTTRDKLGPGFNVAAATSAVPVVVRRWWWSSRRLMSCLAAVVLSGAVIGRITATTGNGKPKG